MRNMGEEPLNFESNEWNDNSVDIQCLKLPHDANVKNLSREHPFETAVGYQPFEMVNFHKIQISSSRFDRSNANHEFATVSTQPPKSSETRIKSCISNLKNIFQNPTMSYTFFKLQKPSKILDLWCRKILYSPLHFCEVYS
ncbi:hypothetical protein TNCV_3700171 [Trichonephila clavipes]|nr:hypothetical protein TNCV_3700171 [Trichonephila clavipes]